MKISTKVSERQCIRAEENSQVVDTVVYILFPQFKLKANFYWRTYSGMIFSEMMQTTGLEDIMTTVEITGVFVYSVT